MNKLFCSNLIAPLLIFLGLLMGCSTLRCQTCLEMECTQGKDCEVIRSLITSEAKSFYFLRTSLSSCQLPANESSSPLTTESSNQCESRVPTCALGRIKVEKLGKSTSDDAAFYATITGCATEQLLERTKNAKLKSLCDVYSKEVYEDGEKIRFQIEHCSRVENLCLHEDNCISQREMKVKRWAEQEPFLTTTRIVLCGILLAALMYLAVVCYGLFVQKS